jgi:sec-independent protein translocase protein TatA
MTVLFAWLNSPWAWLVIGLVAVVLFGRRLPEVARSLGQSMTAFKKGMHGLEDDIVSSTPSSQPAPPPAEAPKVPQRITGAAPKFDSTGAGNGVTPENAPKS